MRILPFGLLSIVLFLPLGCVEDPPDEQILEIAALIRQSDEHLRLRADEELAFSAEHGVSTVISFVLFQKDGDRLRVSGESNTREVGQWRPVGTTSTDPGTGSELYFSTDPFRIVDDVALATNYRLRAVDWDSDWEGRPAWKLQLTPKQPGFSYALVVDSETGLVYRSISFGVDGKRIRSRVLHNVVYLDDVPSNIARRLNAKAESDAIKELEHQRSLLQTIEEAREIVPGLVIPEVLPNGYRIREYREFVDERSVHGVIAEYTDGVSPLIIYTKPYRVQADLARVLNSSGRLLDILPTNGSDREARRIVLVEADTAIGFFDYKLLADSVAIQVLTTLPEREMRGFFETLQVR